MSGLVLSLFPGIGLLDMAFEEEGFTVVRGPDLLWGGDIRRFHVPAGRFDGVIGGPPCKRFSPLANIVRARYGEDAVAADLIPDFCRVIEEAQPTWFLMENVERAPLPTPNGYIVRDQMLNNRWCGGEQNRMRRFSYGTRSGAALYIATEVFQPIDFKPAVTTNSGGRRKVIAFDANGGIRGKQGHADEHRLSYRDVGEAAADQGVPPQWFEQLRKHGAFTVTALRIGIGNGVPLPMGRAVAKAVKAAIAEPDDACNCQAFPTHCANDCPQHGEIDTLHHQETGA